MYCPNCKKNVPDNSIFCNFCGTNLSNYSHSDNSQNSNATSYVHPGYTGNKYGTPDYIFPSMIPQPELENLRIVTYNNGYVIAGYNGTASTVLFPSIYNNSSVIKVYYTGFKDSTIETVIFENGWTVIPEHALSWCKSIKKVILPDTVHTIKKSAFEGCANLSSINIPDSVTTIEPRAFQECGFSAFCFPFHIQELPEAAFAFCKKLEYVSFSPSLIAIGNRAFQECPLKNVVLPNTLKAIGTKAFEGCNELIKVQLPSNIQRINEGAFSGCSSLTSMTFPASITSISDYLLISCSNLKKVIFEGAITGIGEAAFMNCKNLTEISFKHAPIPGSIHLGLYAFRDCPATIPTITTPTHNVRVRYRQTGALLSFGSLKYRFNNSEWFSLSNGEHRYHTITTNSCQVDIQFSDGVLNRTYHRSFNVDSSLKTGTVIVCERGSMNHITIYQESIDDFRSFDK